MTTPAIVSSRYGNTAADYRNCKRDSMGPGRTEYFTVTVPAATAVGTVIGLVPFQTGAKIIYDASTIFTDNLGTGVTATVGYVYQDNANYVDAPASVATALTLATAGPLPQWNVRTAMAWKAGMVPVGTGATLDSGVIANGWIVLVIQGAATGTAGVIDGQITLAYDQP